MADFVDRDSIVRQIWGNGDLVLLVFSGCAAEFALTRAVDWLFFTGKLPRDPIGRFFSTAAYAQQIVFADESTASHALERIRAAHQAVERQRGQHIPDWAHRDVLYMLIDYSERAYALLYRSLSSHQQNELFEVFLRIGEALRIPELPRNYAEWKVDRQRHLVRDLSYSKHTALLYQSYCKHLGVWRYYLLLAVQGFTRAQRGATPPPTQIKPADLRHGPNLRNDWRQYPPIADPHSTNPATLLV